MGLASVWTPRDIDPLSWERIRGHLAIETANAMLD
jgi:hypothetical protein